MKKKLLLLVLFFINIFITNIVIANEKDISIEEMANYLANKWIINDHKNEPSKYNLYDNVLRQEIAAVTRWVAKLEKKSYCENIFSDLSNITPNNWACFNVEVLVTNNIIAKNKNFRPEDNITKSEALWMLIMANWFDYKYDSNLSDSWQEQVVNYAYNKNIIDKFNDYNTPATRGWVFFVANKILIWEENEIKNILDLENQKENILNLKNQTFQISFDWNMDKKSVDTNFIIYPEVKTILNWKDDKTLVIKVNEEINTELDLLVNIANAKQEDWTKISNTIIKKFKVWWINTIDFVTPEWKITDLTKNITVRFSKPIVALSNLDNMWDCPITITPNLPGKCVWITTSTFQFRPEKWFPIWAEYNVFIPNWIKAIDWSKTHKSKSFVIKTPAFEILNSPSKLDKDEKLLINFNAPISIQNFISNFWIDWFNKSNLNITYDSFINNYWEKEERNNIISVFPKTWDWWYDNKYTYDLKSWLKSIRWNNIIWNNKTQNLITNKLLSSYNPFVYYSSTWSNIELLSNLKKSNNKNIITKNNPKILFNFYEEVDLDKWLFYAWGFDFDLKYAKKKDYIDQEYHVSEDKKSIILEIKWDIQNSLNLKVITSKISNQSSDQEINFFTKNTNTIQDFKFIDYNESCLVLQNPISNKWIGKLIDFWGLWTLSHIYEVSRYDAGEKGCEYQEWKYNYILKTKLNPNSDINLIIKKNLLDLYNYPLDRDYNYKFHTNLAYNEDKKVFFVENWDLILVPKDISPIWVAVKSINLDKINIEICEWDFDITNINYLKSKTCIKKEIKINNIWFDTNFSVLNLKEIYGKDFSKNIISLKIDKLYQDKTSEDIEDEKKWYNIKKNYYHRSDISAVLKSSIYSSNLWLSSFKTWENLTDQILSIDSYKKENQYSTLWKFIWYTHIKQSSLSFLSKKDWIYIINWKIDWNLLITLKSWEQVVLKANNSYRDTTVEKVYLSTDKPIYKPWDTVKIKWTLRVENDASYSIWKWNKTITIKDSRYKNLISKNISLNKNGSFEYEFKLDKSANLWEYRISVWYNSLYFLVEKFEKPDFKIESNTTKSNYLYNQIPQLKISANYYVWASLANWEWTYDVSVSDFNFDGWTKWYYWWDNKDYWSYYKITRSQKFDLDSKGEVVLDIDTSKTTKDKIYNIDITVTDPNTKKSISSGTSFNLLNSNVFVWMKFDKYYYNYKDTAKFEFATVDIDWNKKSNQDLVLKIYKIDYKYDENIYKTIREEKVILEKELVTDDGWKIYYNYDLLDTWEYRFEIELANNKYKTTKTIYVSWFNLIKPIKQEHNIVILKDKDKYNIWEQAEFVIQSDII